MESNDASALARLMSLTLIAVAMWFFGNAFSGLPSPRGLDAPATEFSAARAGATLGRLLGPEVPHPVSTPANAAVRDRVRAEFAALGVKTSVYRGLGCLGRAKLGYFSCGTTEDILAEVAPGEGKAIILMAHYDSVPAGPGASDDQSGVATILETVRALQVRGMKTMHPVLALITDGEEAGLLGAASFLDNPTLKARVGAVINVEARGNRGPSLLFQTSPGDGPLIDLYANSVPEMATSSLFAVIYKLLPNDTDLTLFINQGFTSFNFAFSGNVAHYHTPLDLRANLSPATLQHHGDNMLGVAGALMQTDFAKLKGSDDIYISLFGKVLPRLPASWALPLAALTLVLLLLTAYLLRVEVPGIGRWLLAFALPPAAILGSAGIGWVLHQVAVLISGQPDPSYAFPLAMRIALGLGVAAVVVLVSRMAGTRLTALTVWLWMSALAVTTAVLLPGLSPYFLFPALIGSVLVLVQARLPGAWSGTFGSIVLFIAALAPLAIFISLAAGGESAMGLITHPLFTVPVALGAICLLPVAAARPLSRRGWLLSVTVLAVAALATAGIAGMQPAYSSVAPQRLAINFVDDHVTGKALWSLDTQARLPQALRAVANFSAKPELGSPLSFRPTYLASAGATRFAAPTATVTSTPQGSGRRVTLALQGSEQANQMFVLVPKGAGLTKVEIEGKSFVPAKETQNPRGTFVGCVTVDCRTKTVVLEFDSLRPVDVVFGEQRFSLPPDGVRLQQARPNTAITSQSGDTTLVFGKVTVP